MKKIFLVSLVLMGGLLSTAVAQQRESDSDTTRRLPDTANNRTFHDDSTDATEGNSNLSGSSGTAAASGAGGQGAVQNPGYNTSSDIYNIERRDSIERAKEDSVQNLNKRNPPTD